jgi:hypothetical protein
MVFAPNVIVGQAAVSLALGVTVIIQGVCVGGREVGVGVVQLVAMKSKRIKTCLLFTGLLPILK